MKRPSAAVGASESTPRLSLVAQLSGPPASSWARKPAAPACSSRPRWPPWSGPTRRGREPTRRSWAAEAGVSVAGWALTMDLGHWVNDGAMALFFFVIGLEVRREFSVGELTTPRRAAIPVIAAVGGLVVPALLYLALTPGGEAARAWGLVIGTDTAFLLGALAVVGPAFATRLRIFLLTLTVIDDIVAVSVIGLVYSDSPGPWRRSS